MGINTEGAERVPGTFLATLARPSRDQWWRRAETADASPPSPRRLMKPQTRLTPDCQLGSDQASSREQLRSMGMREFSRSRCSNSRNSRDVVDASLRTGQSPSTLSTDIIDVVTQLRLAAASAFIFQMTYPGNGREAPAPTP